MNQIHLPAIEIETDAAPDAAVIWLHGLGADGSDFVPVVPELGLPDRLAVRFVFPHAPLRPVTINNGFVMRAWYDVMVLSDNSRQADEAGMRASVAAVRALIEREHARGIDCQRIVLGGFSQGGAIAYTAGLTHPDRLAGIVALSAYLPAPQLVLPLSDANRDTPIFAAHGSEDDVLPIRLGERARDFLHEHGYPLSWHRYPMPHAVCQEEIRALGEWLAAILGGAKS